MKKLKFCQSCKIYTLSEICKKCKSKTKDAHYKFIIPYSEKKEKSEN